MIGLLVSFFAVEVQRICALVCKAPEWTVLEDTGGHLLYQFWRCTVPDSMQERHGAQRNL
jgi:hypothetical protein